MAAHVDDKWERFQYDLTVRGRSKPWGDAIMVRGGAIKMNSRPSAAQSRNISQTLHPLTPAPLPRRAEGRLPRGREEETACFMAVYIRRALEPRLQGHGRIAVRRSGATSFIVIHHYVSEWNGRAVELAVAQLRAEGPQWQLFWRRANGRWAPYENTDQTPFAGSLDACLKEIYDDRWSCFWG